MKEAIKKNKCIYDNSQTNKKFGSKLRENPMQL